MTSFGVLVRMWAFDALLAKLRADSYLASFELAPMMFEFRWPSAEFQRLRAVWDETPKATARLEFDIPKEVEQTCALYEVWSVESAQNVSETDDAYFRDHEQNGPILKGAEEGVRYFPDVCISKVKPKPKRILSLDVQVPVHLITRDCADDWRAEDFSGLGFGQVVNRKSKPFEDVALIVPQCVLGPMARGENVVRNEEEGRARDLVLGFCIYSAEAIARACDFNLSKEPQYSFAYPKVFVSRRFVEMYRTRKYRGWKFRPVLEQGSAAEEEFTRTLRSFLSDWRSGSKENRIVGP